MKRAEAKQNVGKKVKYVGNCKEVADSFKMYDFVILRFSSVDDEHVSVQCNALPTLSWHLHVKDIELVKSSKELREKVKDFKIKVANETESKEVQKLLFGLGYAWLINQKEYCTLSEDHFIVTFSDGVILQAPLDHYNTNHEKHQELTLPQLRDLVVLHRNDVSDATHESDFVEHKFFVSSENKAYEFRENKWQPKICKSLLEPIVKQQPKKTWQDALREYANGKEVEFYSELTLEWVDISSITIGSLKGSQSKFRLAPQRKELNGNFTKEELLKIAGEMA